MDRAKILIVNSDPMSEEASNMMLEKDYDFVGIASSVEEARFLAEKYPPDLALVDISLRGERDGIELARMLSREYCTGIIFVTDVSEDEVLSVAREMLPHGCLPKPYSQQDLKSAIEAAISRKRSDRSEMAGEAKPRTTFERCREWVYLIRSDGVVEQSSQPGKERTDYSQPECKDDPKIIGEIVFIDDRDLFYRHQNHYLGSQQISEIDLSIKTHDGTTRSIRHHCTPDLPQQENPIKRDASIGDIMERKGLEAKSDWLKAAIEAIDLGITLCDPEGRILYCNPAEAQMHGYSVEELIGKPAKELAPMDLWRKMSDESLSTSTGFRRESVNARKDGSRFPVELVSVPVKDVGRRVQGIITSCLDITDRKANEQVLLDFSQKLLHHFHNTPLAYIEWDSELRVRDWNPSAEILFGYAKSEAIGRHAFDIIVPIHQRPSVEPVWRKLVDQSGGLRHTNINNTKDGREIICSWYNTPLHDEEGKTIGIASLAEDVTARESALIKLQESETRFKNLFEKAVDGMAVLTEEGEVIAANETQRLRWGVTEEDLADVVIWHSFAERESLAKYMISATIAKGSLLFESVFAAPCGTRIPMEIYLKAFMWEGKRAILCVLRDITERKAAEEALAKRQKALQAVYSLATTRAEKRELTMDRILQQIAGLFRPEFTMCHLKNTESEVIIWLMRGAKAAERMAFPKWATLCPFAKSAQGALDVKPVIWTGTLADICQDNPVFMDFGLGSMISVPLHNVHGSLMGCLTVGDSAERRFNEEEVNLLEIFSKYLSFELEEERLQSKLVEAEKAKIITKVVSGIAHEVRNPLNAINALVEVLHKKMGNNQDMERFFVHAKAQVDRLAELMREMLELGRPIDPKEKRVENPENLCKIAIHLWREGNPGDAHEVRLAVSPGAGEVKMIANQQKIQQILINLLDNASQHSPPASPIDVEIKIGKDRTFSISVCDRGKGIPQENIDKIFEPFFTTRKGGTGLGLSIVRHIVEDHGGVIAIRNNSPEAGCTAEISLPACEA